MESNKYNILYVDDEVGNLRVFQASFKKQYNVFIAESGAEALEVLAANHIQLIITDQKMPKMTGVELLEEVVKIYPDIIKIILTGFTDVEDIMQALNKCGIYRYLMKPWEKAEMKITLDKALEIHQLRKHKEELLEELQTNNEQLEERIKERTEKLSLANEQLTQEIEDRKVIEQNLKEAKDRAEEASKAKQMFLSTMSHEIRTPLNAVIGMAHLLQQSSLDEAQQDNLKLLLFSAKNLLTLINDILDLSRIEAGKLELEELPFDFSELMRNLSNAHKSKAIEQNLAYNIKIDPHVPSVLVGDQTRLGQILNNLLSNAFKFTSEGGVHIKVDYLGQEVGEKVRLRFSVSDTGIGIPKEKQDVIFEHFSQASSETTRKYGGSGLGLAICSKLIEAQGGIFGVESEDGKGSTFYFEVPFAVSHFDPNGASKAEQVNLPQNYAENLSHLKILLVEDNKINQILMRKFFSKWQVNYELAENGLEAVEKVQSKAFDLVLMDIQMPELDGYGATEAIRGLDGDYYKTLPIIALTASTLQGEESRIRDVGMNDYVVKPFDPKMLSDKILFYTTGIEPNDQAISVSPDLSSFKELMEDDDEGYIDLIEATLRDLDELKGSVFKFKDNKDVVALQKSTHNMKPPLEMMGLSDIYSDLRELRDAEEDEQVTVLFDRVKAKLVSLESNLRAEI